MSILKFSLALVMVEFIFSGNFVLNLSSWFLTRAQPSFVLSTWSSYVIITIIQFMNCHTPLGINKVFEANEWHSFYLWILAAWFMVVDKCKLFYPTRFGSIIAGALRAKLSAKREKNGGTKGSLETKKRQRGSFSFLGGMQVVIVVIILSWLEVVVYVLCFMLFHHHYMLELHLEVEI